MLLEVGKVFDGERPYFPMIVNEEAVFTINNFFENSLNVSETDRQMFIHRNTILYRIEKVKRITSIDLKIFEHAETFKIALMVSRYLKNNPIKYLCFAEI